MTKNQISHDDIEAKLSNLQTGFGRKIADRKKTIMTVGAGVGLGRRHRVLPARPAQRCEEDDHRRDPPGVRG